jgi:hypothetical protein
MALINYNDLVNMLKNHYDFLTNIPDEIEIEIENKNISGIKELKILLKDIITLDNIILNEDKNDQFMFIAMKRNETLFLHPYTPESFNGTIEVKGLQEQLTRMPIVLQKIGDVDSINLSEDSWSILPRDLFLKIFRDN